MRSHRDVCTGQPCGCCRWCGEWSWRGNVCNACGRTPSGEAGKLDAPEAPAAAPAHVPGNDLVSLFDLPPSDTQPPTKKGIDLI